MQADAAAPKPALRATGRRSVLVLNAGSSSFKFAVFGAAEPPRGEIENLNDAPRFCAVDGQGAPLAGPAWPASGPSDFAAIIKILMKFVAGRLADGVLIGGGHRVAHGGGAHVKPERVTPAPLDSLQALTPLDPIHLVAALEVRVIKTDELAMIARHTPALLGDALSPTAP